MLGWMTYQVVTKPGVLELNCRRPQSLTKSQYNCKHCRHILPKVHNMVMSPSSNHLLAHCQDK
ncbi:hypothetical protein EJB05_44901, partial [Eragrostis curvula]